MAAGVALLFLGEDVPLPLARGDAAPAFELPGLDGQNVELASLRGRVVLLNFWATWCKPCEDEMPAMERLHRALGAQGLELVAVSVDKDPAEVEAFRDRLGLSFPILLDPDESVSRRYQTTGYPESLLIDRQGRLVERYVGPRPWDDPVHANRIRELLGEG